MKCRDAKEMLNSYFDNKIDPMEDKLLAEHIKSCPECRAELDFLIRYKKILKTVKPAPAPDNFLHELRRRINSENKTGSITKVLNTIRGSIRIFNFPLEAAGVLALAMLVFFLYRPFYNETVPEKSYEYTIESPAGESALMNNTGRTLPAENAINPDRFEPDYDAAKDKIDPPSGKAILKEEAPLYNTADDKISAENEKNSRSQSRIEMNKTRSFLSEKEQAADEEKSLSSERGYNGGVAEEAVNVKKDSYPLIPSYPDNIFRKYNVSVIKKDLSDSKKSYYRIKVDLNRYSPFINDLKAGSDVNIKIITRTETFYEIEIFIKNNEN
jgi:hypothetical protein